MTFLVLLLAEAGSDTAAAAVPLAAEMGLGVRILPPGATSGEIRDGRAPDLLLLDVAAAGKRSLELLRGLRADPYLRSIPLIALIPATSVSEVAAWFEAGASDYLTLPLQAPEFRARIRGQKAIRLSGLGKEAPGRATAGAGGPRAFPTGADLRSRILVVDDSPSSIRTLIEFLRHDYKTLVARSGTEALEIAAREPLDLILLDIVMPHMDGYEVCRRLREDAMTSGTPIIFVTGRNEETDEMHGFELGAVDFVVKPFSLPIVQSRIRTHLELKRHRDRLERSALLDGLTGIPNRRHFESFLGGTWAQAQRGRRSCALLMIDVDHFKRYNDHYGHAAGDECLRRVAGALQAGLHRDADLLARYGGEEFSCVLPDTDLPGAVRMAEALRTQVSALGIPHAGSPVASNVSVSLGAASAIPSPGDPSSLLIEAADRALYRAKHDGRDRVGS